MKIITKLSLSFLPLALITLIVLGSLSYFGAKEALTTEIVDKLKSVAAIQKRHIERIVEQNHERLALVSSRTQLRLSLRNYIAEPREAYREKLNRILHDAGATIGAFRTLFIQTLDGRIVAATDPDLIGQVHASADYFVEARRQNRVDLFYRDAQGQPGVYLAGPLYLDSRLLGILVISSDVSNVFDATTDYHGLGNSGETLLVRRNHESDALFLTPARFDTDAALLRTVSGRDPQSPYSSALLGKENLFTDAIGYDGQPIIAVARYIDNLNSGLVVQMRASEAFAPIDRLRTLLITLVGLFSVAVILVSLSMARSITRPISRLTGVATRISGGDLSQRADTSSRDEVGTLASAFNQMTENLIHDINERRQAEEKFQSLLKSAPDAIVIVDQSGQICLANLQAEQLFGYEQAELIGKPVELLMPERYRAGHEHQREMFAADPKFRPMTDALELSGVRKDGTEFPIEISLAPLQTKEGLLVTSAIRDITERKQAEERLVQQANFDTLTGLPNRLLAADRLSQALARSQRRRNTVAVMFLDIDRFKDVNDTLGHAVGDKLLKEVAQRLTRRVRSDDTVARLGGDEFLIILPELDVLADAEIVAEEVLRELSQPYVLDDREMFISASIGITGYPQDSHDPDVLLRNADVAMYRAKEAGRNTFRFFTSEMNVQLLRRLEMESHLRYAIRNEELFLHFQPQIDINNGQLVGAEALLRWENSELGLISPDEFIPLAEETGLINAIGEWVLNEACAAASTWHQRFSSAVRVSVNVSAVQFRSGELVTTVSRALEASGLPASLLDLEITERLLVEDNPNTSRILKDLKSMGVRLSLDDFGKGYSSLSYLKRFPFDILKIDRAFVSGVMINPEDAALCKAISAMANSLNLSVVGEGVETEEQLEFLRLHGTDLVQGYYISRPLALEAFIEFMSGIKVLLAH